MNQNMLDLQPTSEYRTISLTQGQVAIVDLDDYEYLNQWKWQARWHKETQSFYASRVGKADGKLTTISMHRVIMKAKKGVKVDHVHHNTLDNRKSELRLATHTENMHNIRKRTTNTTGYTGVSWNKQNQKFQAWICVNSKNRFLGLFATAEEASAVYQAAAASLRGEFHNPQPNTQAALTFEIKTYGNMKSTNTTGYSCVLFNKRKGRFYVHITHNGKRYVKGYFDTAEEAHKIAESMRAKLS